MKGGWYLMHRGWMGSPDFKPEAFTEREAFMWSIEQAAIKPHVQWFNGIEIAVGRGEFATSSRKLATAFRWGEKRARLFMERMERRGKWTLRAAQQGAHVATILSVCNYERFQTPLRPAAAANDADEGEPGAQLGRSEDAQQKEGSNKGNEGKKERAPRADPLPYAQACADWEQVAAAKPGWKPKKATLTPKRQRGLADILKKHGLEGWRQGLQRAADSALLGGPDPPPNWWNFEFATRPDKFQNVFEGNYDDKFSSNSAQRASGWAAGAAALGYTSGVSQPLR